MFWILAAVTFSFAFGLAIGEVNGEARATYLFNKQFAEMKFGKDD